ncbi:MAG TPA: HAMP domain-containing sensor histidine kinase [Candidatus Dormibacteraeota bacterium]|nr:HAMP domain-containing sensor histidine kinase [Candidatus Dormibacteraeota bacterium]
MPGRPAPSIRPLDDLWARRLSRRPGASVAVAIACLAALGALVFGDAHTPVGVTFGSLEVIPIGAACWLLAPRPAIAVLLGGLALRVLDIAVGGVHPVTGAFQAVLGGGIGLLVIGLASSAQARSLMEQRARGIRRLTRLLDALRSLGPERDQGLSLAEILAGASAVFGTPGTEAPRTFLAAVDGDRLRVTLERNRTDGPPMLGESFPRSDAVALQPAMDDGVAVTVRRRQLRGAARQLAARLDVATLVAGRVRAGGRIQGLLCVGFPDDRWFDVEELRLLQAMGHLAGMAMDAASAVSLERRQTDELRRRADQIAELETMKREFLLLASHELRSPLAVARGYAAMLRDGSLGEPPEAFGRALAIMDDKLGEIGALVEDMLETARLESGHLDLSASEVDLRDVVTTAVARLQPVVGDRHSLAVDLPGRPVVVRGDTERLRRIAVNLLDNAVKYSPDGGAVECVVGVHGRLAEMRVSDHGIGIAADAQPRMFQRFGRIVTPQTSSIPGTGLGLYLCRELARAHGGDITVESREGEGSTFTVTLPLQRSGARA